MLVSGPAFPLGKSTSVDTTADSVAAGIQASIGSIAAGSTFAVFTSAGMGGYGAAIVFGSAWAVPMVCLGATAAWKRWQGARDRDYGSRKVIDDASRDDGQCR